jgi:hypothetical protein
MPRTPDRYDGISLRDAIGLEETALPPTEEGETRYVGGAFSMRDSAGLFDPRSGSGLSEAQHRALRQLIHFIDNGPAEGFSSGAFRETLPAAAPFPTSVAWYVDNTKAEKIVDLTITYTGVLPTSVQWRVYDTDGSTVLATVTDAVSYTGVFETSRTRTIA